ncbi:MAG TPA: tannase/feruloyl esterase family alpha/beta hydrolase [Steroidobacteraceae bacterium]
MFGRNCIPAWLAGAAALAAFDTQLAAAAPCAQLADLKLPHATITGAEPVAAGAFKAAAAGGGGPGAPATDYGHLPAFCRVAGTLHPTADSDIRFEVWLPASGWNGKFVGTGNGVWAGSIVLSSMAEPLSKGYATMATDDGHQGSPLDGSFAAGHPEKLIDFGYRAVHETTVAAKELVKAFYDKPASRSLFVSCSTGGRQGLMEAYRYPKDYDGISAMAPANPMVGLMIASLWTGVATLKDSASQISRQKFALVHKAVLQACDARDGVTDGIVSRLDCDFDPQVLQCKGHDGADCLTGSQVAALRAIYAGVHNPRTGKLIYPGFQPGSEDMLPILTMGPEPFPVATTFFRALVFRDPKWDFRNFDYDHDVERSLQVGHADLDVPPTGVEGFLAGGRKLLLSHGMADGLIPTRSTVNFYTALTHHAAAKESANARLFLVPGMGHCGGGEGPSVIDTLSSIDGWVGSGRAPQRIIASNPPGTAPRTRPLCPYPQQAVYTGRGSTDEEQNFRCEAPAH